MLLLRAGWNPGILDGGIALKLWMASGGRGDPQDQPQSGNKQRPAAVLGLEAALVSGSAASSPPAVPLEVPFYLSRAEFEPAAVLVLPNKMSLVLA